MIKLSVVLLSLFFMISACDGEPLESENQVGFSNDCKGKAKYSSLEPKDTKWLLISDDKKVELNFTDTFVNVVFTCSEDYKGVLSSQNDTKASTLNIEDKIISIQQPLVFSVHFTNSNNYCNYSFSEKYEYSFAGTCLVLEKDKKKYYYKAVQK